MDTYGSTASQGEGHPRRDQPVESAPVSPSVGAPAPPSVDVPAPPPAGSPTAAPPVPSSTDVPALPIATQPFSSSADAPTRQPADPSSAAVSADVSIPPADEVGQAHLFGYLAVYTLLRLVLVALLTAVLTIFMPLIVAVLFAIIIQLPLSWLLFAGPRRRVNQAMARSSAQRRAERDRLQAALSGEEPPA